MTKLGYIFEVNNSTSQKASLKITGGIGWWKNDGESFTRKVDDLIRNGAVDLHVYINTPGGSMLDANEIGNQIQRFTGNRTARLGALVASAGTLIASYFPTQNIEASANTQYMIHDPMVRPDIKHLSDFESAKAMYENLRNNAIDQYHNQTGIDKAELSTMLEKTTWMNAETAKKKGFIGSISTDNDKATSDANNILNSYGDSLPDMVLTVLNETKLDNQKEDMKQIALAHGLAENATEQEIIAAVHANKTAVSDTALEALGSLAELKGLDVESIKSLGKTNYDGAFSLVKNHKVQDATPPVEGAEGKDAEDKKPEAPAQVSVSDLVAELRKGKGEDKPSAKSYDDLTPEQRMELEKSNPEEFTKLFNEKFNG